MTSHGIHEEQGNSPFRDRQAVQWFEDRLQTTISFLEEAKDDVERAKWALDLEGRQEPPQSSLDSMRGLVGYHFESARKSSTDGDLVGAVTKIAQAPLVRCVVLFLHDLSAYCQRTNSARFLEGVLPVMLTRMKWHPHLNEFALSVLEREDLAEVFSQSSPNHALGIWNVPLRTLDSELLDVLPRTKLPTNGVESHLASGAFASENVTAMWAEAQMRLSAEPAASCLSVAIAERHALWALTGTVGTSVFASKSNCCRRIFAPASSRTAMVARHTA